ncbi:MAG: neutral/alkaline non-lysosomal ceramidase N-terminal domain-containing protein [Bryobacteraceae bacterium]
MRLALVALIAAAAGLAAGKADFEAGAASVDITPEGPIWLSGYAARTHASDGVLSPIQAKALALRDRKGYRIVIVTADVVGLPRGITDAVAARLEKEHGLRRAQVVFNASHTHTGPVIWPNLTTMYFISDEEKAKLHAYAATFTEKMYSAAAAALGDLAPAEVTYGEGAAGFARNRRQGEKGPVDHSVPVFDVRTTDGKRKAILFGYACHNTTLTGEHYQVSGDYAGYAQAALEKEYPGSVALFLMLAGADQNPNPRSKVELAEGHGASLASAVRAVIDGGKMAPVREPVKSAYQTIELAFAPHTRDQFEAEAKDENRYKASRAREMLAAYDSGHPKRSTPYPVQVIRFGRTVTLVALGGEVVVDYARRFKDTFQDKLVVAGYSNDVMCYIPSVRILREGGYEGDTSMIYYGQPGKFTEDVEEDIFRSVRGLLKRVGGK